MFDSYYNAKCWLQTLLQDVLLLLNIVWPFSKLENYYKIKGSKDVSDMFKENSQIRNYHMRNLVKNPKCLFSFFINYTHKQPNPCQVFKDMLPLEHCLVI